MIEQPEVVIDGVTYVPSPEGEDLNPPSEIAGFIFGVRDFDEYFSERWFPVLWPDGIPEQKALSDQDLIDAAKRFDVPIQNLDAVRQVESNGSGFLLNERPPLRPKILFEGHWFYKLTPKPVSKVRPDLSYPTWTKEYYLGGSEEWMRLRDAAEFDLLNALKSASWGMGQVMGFNYELAGCQSIEEFVVQAFTGEAEQFNHMLMFIQNNNLINDLRRGDWAGFAKGYNGASYAQNKYDVRLAQAAANSVIV